MKRKTPIFLLLLGLILITSNACKKPDGVCDECETRLRYVSIRELEVFDPQRIDTFDNAQVFLDVDSTSVGQTASLGRDELHTGGIHALSGNETGCGEPLDGIFCASSDQPTLRIAYSFWSFYPKDSTDTTSGPPPARHISNILTTQQIFLPKARKKYSDVLFEGQWFNARVDVLFEDVPRL